MSDAMYLAALDLGSNSFRLEISQKQVEGGQYPLLRTDYAKETVRLGASLSEQGFLSKEGIERGLSCLQTFANRLQQYPIAQVRAVATQTLREAINREELLVPAHKILGFPIEVIAGREEARLIYLGVAHALEANEERRLVIDIGGRSTEMILGQGFVPRMADSYQVGCVGLSLKFFADGRCSSRSFQQAVVAAKAALEEALGFINRKAWDTAYGSSGTVGAVINLLQANHRGPDIQLTHLHWLRDKMIEAGELSRLRVAGLREDRKPVIAGGLAILIALFELFEIDTLKGTKGALRHGVLYELLKREQESTDTRVHTVLHLQQRFHINRAQAQHVQRCALALYEPLHSRLRAHEEQRKELAWAAALHEMGLLISPNNYHKHGAYILENIDAAGFSETELAQMATLVRGQRGGLRKIAHSLFDATVRAQILALRLAVILCHPHTGSMGKDMPLNLDLTASLSYRLYVKRDALSQQTLMLLQEEAQIWEKAGWRLELVYE